MTRVLTFACALLALVGLAFLPTARPTALAALHGGVLLDELVSDPGLSGEELALWELILDSPHYSEAEQGKARLVLGQVELSAPDLALDSPDSTKFKEAILRGLRQKVAFERDRELEVLEAEPGAAGLALTLEVAGAAPLVLHVGVAAEVQPEPGAEDVFVFDWRPASPTSLLPPLVAILLAVLLRRPVISLFTGVLAGALLLRWAGTGAIYAKVFGGLSDVFSVFLLDEVLDRGGNGRLHVIGFVIAMLAMVGVITKNGGIRGLMNIVARFARTARSTQVATYLMGLAVFFDDYANTILVGSTMRPLTDRYRIAREKLAYIVDSTAAPVAGLSIFSTWIAFEVSTFSAQLPLAGLSPDDGYSIFIQTLPYRFYCILTLGLVLMVTVSGRDFGPMLKAERRARKTGQLVREGGTPMVSDAATAMEPAASITIRAWRALVPLGVFVGVTVWTILSTGGAFAKAAPSLFTIQGLSSVLGDADSYVALWRGSSMGLLTAVVASLFAGLRLEILDAAWKTLKSMGIALAILYLAWMIGAVCGKLGTASYLTVMLDQMLMPLALPVILFLLSGVIAFSTGSSWSTMSILLPLVVGLAFSLGEGTEIGGLALVVLSIGAVLEGSIFGDHCSPISDTTVLSSVASASDHIDHVRTQAPYALLCMGVAIVAGYLPAAVFGTHPLVSLAAGLGVLGLALYVFGARADDPGQDAA
ncbi:MAG TPA: Na+/H+ antiporter NhaC family protein [Planctomycetes bacterium]|nr:Na+/H+ antiporter NhaC family protein [Planctomycetota bacterium]HIL52159.1 Na+/H+ antiporter NhaC family protein [Planctomycetota bacterium]